MDENLASDKGVQTCITIKLALQTKQALHKAHYSNTTFHVLVCAP